VIIGGGFGGLAGANALRRAPVEVTLIDRQTHHLFQPLLYHLATGILSEGNVSAPLRDVLRQQRNAQVVLAEVSGVDLERRTVACTLLDRTWEIASQPSLPMIGARAGPLRTDASPAPNPVRWYG
jgi:NADH dehydrogenase